MVELALEKLKAYREQTYRSTPDLRLRSPQEAVEFVNQRGFIFFWPIKNTELPSLWVATAGDRPVPNNHDDPGHVTWGWKDQMLGKHLWYYGRVLKRRNTILSLEMLPYFYALSPNYGEFETDYLEQYHLGKMTYEAKLLYEALLQSGPLDTISLHRKTRLTAPSSATRFNHALDVLQMEFKILPIGTSKAGTWHYSFVYDIVPRHFPALEQEARSITEKEAREKLAYLYLQSVGAVQIQQLASLFKWSKPTTSKVIASLKTSGVLVDEVSMPNQKGTYLALKELL